MILKCMLSRTENLKLPTGGKGDRQHKPGFIFCNVKALNIYYSYNKGQKMLEDAISAERVGLDSL